MSILKLGSKFYRFLPASEPTVAGRAWSCLRPFVTAAPRPLQSKKDAETCQDVKEAADAVKDCSKEVRETSKFMRDTAATTAKKVSKMTKDVTEKVTEAAETIKGKTKDYSSGVWGTAKATTEIIKDKIAGK